MKIRKLVLALALVAPLSVAWAAKPVDPASLPEVKCSDFKFSKAFLERYPKAPAACLEGRMKGGVKYAKFSAKVFDTNADRTTVQLLNVSGDAVTTFSFKPKPGAAVMINGKKVKFTDLAKDEVLTFWVPESKMIAKSMPAATADSWQVLPPQ